MEIRPAAPDEFEDFVRTGSLAFGRRFDPEAVEHSRLVTEPDRNLAAFEGGRMIAVANASTFRLSVPGGEVGAAGLRGIGVLPTHRRRGTLAALMRRQLDGVRQRGEPVSVLWASEAAIYGRFGYGLGTLGLRWEIARLHASLPDHADAAELRVRLVDQKEALARFPVMYETERQRRPGMVDRPEPWWRRHLHDPVGDLFLALVEDDDGAPAAYATYRVSTGWGPGGPQHGVRVVEAVAPSPAGYLAVWRYVFGIDLVTTVTASNRPLDEQLVWMLADPRKLQRWISDGLWVRLVDVAKALAGRRYPPAPATLAVEVTDAFCPWNDGTYRLEVDGGGGARCEADPTAQPDLRLTAAELGALYLGSVDPADLAWAGRIEECRPDALAAAAALFRWQPPAWAPAFF